MARAARLRRSSLVLLGLSVVWAGCGDDGGTGGGGEGGSGATTSSSGSSTTMTVSSSSTTSSSTTGSSSATTTSASTTSSATTGAGGEGGAPPDCVAPGDCDDGSLCTDDDCVGGQCENTPVDVDDANACTVDACDPSAGVSHAAVNLDDANACTVDACDPVTGVSHTPVSVDDGSTCTVDACDPATGTVTHLPGPNAPVLVMGPKSPLTGANNTGVGTEDWTSFSNIVSQNADDSFPAIGSAWSRMSSSGPITNYLVASNFDFSLPSDAIIQGLEVNFRKRGRDLDLTYSVTDHRVRIVKAGVIQSTDRSKVGAWPAVFTNFIYGSASDLWGTTWTPAQINATDFGVAIAAKWDGIAGNDDAIVDHLTMSVHYKSCQP